MLITLALGLASVGFVNWLYDYVTEISVDLPKVEFGSPIFVYSQEYNFNLFGGGRGANCDFEPIILVTNKYKRHKISRK